MKPTILLPALCLLAATACASVQAPAAAEEPATENASVESAVPAPGDWFTDFGQAKAFATEKHLPLFLNFTGSDWCPWCKFADARVFSHEEWREYAASHVVPVFIDFPNKSPLSDTQRKANEALAKKYGIRGFPTFLVLSPDGAKILGQFGVTQNESFKTFTEKLDKILRANQ